MCQKTRILSTTKSGQLSKSEKGEIYQLEFNNIYFEFDRNQLESFRSYLSTIEISYWERDCARSQLKRKIPIASLQENLILIFSRQEIYELRKLLGLIENTDSLHIGDIDYELSLN